MHDNISLKSKSDCQKLLLSLINPLKSHFSKGSARVLLDGCGTTYSQSVIEFESFARPLWGLVPFWIGGGRDEAFERLYQKGLESGTDPDSPEYWGNCEEKDQRFVEMAPIAFGLMTVPEILWNPLSDRAKENLSSWLGQINNHDMPKSNWRFFRILVNAALKSLGCRYSQERVDEDSAFIESCYLGDGWYEDGVSKRIDYYSSFAMQFYSIINALYGYGDISLVSDRANMFAKDFMLWFSSDGAPLAYGRSLTYRFATCAFFSSLALIPDANLELGRIKGIINRDIRFFLSNDIFNSEGILTVGYGYPNQSMAERYNSPGSPYWSLKAFLFLALPDDHEYWKTEEMPIGIEDGIYQLDKARMLIEYSEGLPSVYVPGMLGFRKFGHYTEKYEKFVYTSYSAFSVSHSIESLMECSPDNMLAFEIDNYFYVRRGSLGYWIDNGTIYSKWSVPGIIIETTISPFKHGHIRTHRIESTLSCRAYDSGYSIEGQSELDFEEDGKSIKVSNGKFLSSIEGSGECTLSVVNADPNSNVLYKNSVFPTAMYEIKKGITIIEDRFYTGKCKN